MQLHFTFTRNPQFLSEEDVYAITPVHDPAELLKEGGYIETDGERLRLTEKGLYVMNDIIVRLAM